MALTTDSRVESPADSLVHYVAGPIYRARGWIRFISVMAFVGGGIYGLASLLSFGAIPDLGAGGLFVFGFFGLLFAAIPIAFGVWLWQTANAIKSGYEGSGGDAVEDIHRAQDKLRLIFVVYGVLMAIPVGLMIISIGLILITAQGV